MALIVVIATVVGIYGYITVTAQPEPYNTMYLLDSSGKAVDYPHTLVAGQNSTFGVNVVVVNHMNSEQTYVVRTKVAKSLLLTSNGVDAPTIDTYSFTIPDKASNQHTVLVGEATPGNYTVVYELWNIHENGDYIFTGNYCVLNVQVTD